MAKPGQYTRSRRTIMQAIMWLVLGGTVGLAALVRNTHSRPVELEPAEAWGSLEVRSPKGWLVDKKSTWLTRRQMIWIAREPAVNDADETGRVVTFYQEPTSGKMLPGAYLASARDVRAGKFVPFKFGARSGVRTVVRTRLETPEGFATGTTLWACTILESGLAVSIRLDVTGGHGPDDERLLQRLADGIRFNDESVAAAASPATEPAANPE